MPFLSKEAERRPMVHPILSGTPWEDDSTAKQA